MAENNIKAFILEDDEAFIRILKDTMADHNVNNCEFFANPSQLLRTITEDDYIFIIDYILPQYDGIYVLQEIIKRNKDAKVIMLSMQAEATVIATALNEGLWKYHDKRGGYEAILETVNNIKFARALLAPIIKRKKDMLWLRRQGKL